MGGGRQGAPLSGRAAPRTSAGDCTRPTSFRLDVLLRRRRTRDQQFASLHAGTTAKQLRRHTSSAIRCLYDPAGLRALSTKSGTIEFSSLFWPGAKRYFDALAQPAAGALRARTCTRAGRGRSGERGPLLPALRQITVSRALGGDLRLLYPAFSVRHLRPKVARPQKPGDPHPIGFHAAALRMGRCALCERDQNMTFASAGFLLPLVMHAVCSDARPGPSVSGATASITCFMSAAGGSRHKAERGGFSF